MRATLAAQQAEVAERLAALPKELTGDDYLFELVNLLDRLRSMLQASITSKGDRNEADVAFYQVWERAEHACKHVDQCNLARTVA
jgi:hypothetical protein